MTIGKNNKAQMRMEGAMIKTSKKVLSFVLAIAMLLSTTACSGGDKSWSVKNDNLTVPIGVYIYNLYASYQMAESSVPDKTKPVLDQKIEGKDAESYIKEKALNYTKMLLVMEDKMKEHNLKLTDEEQKAIQSATETQWQQAGGILEKYGVAKTSFQMAFAKYYVKFQKIFTAVYGKGGKKAVPDDELKKYFEGKYTDFSMISKPLSKSDASGAVTALSSDEKEKAKKEFDEYAADIKSGKKTMRQAADAYKASSKSEADVLENYTQPLASSPYFKDFAAVLDKMQPGEVKATEIAGSYVVIMKNDIKNKTAEYLKNESNRNEILVNDKGQEFSDEMDKLAAEYKNAQINESAINSYKPSMFVTPSESAAAPASSVASK